MFNRRSGKGIWWQCFSVLLEDNEISLRVGFAEPYLICGGWRVRTADPPDFLVGMLRTRFDESFQTISVFPFFEFCFSVHGILFIIKFFSINNYPWFTGIWISLWFIIVFRKSVRYIGRISDIKSVNFLWVKNINRVHKRETPRKQGFDLWGLTGSNRRPSACKADALNQLS